MVSAALAPMYPEIVYLFQIIKENECSPEWASEEEILAVTQKRRDCIFVFEQFQGEAFEHIKGTGNKYVLIVVFKLYL